LDLRILTIAIFEASVTTGERPTIEAPSRWTAFEAFEAVGTESPATRSLWTSTAAEESTLRKVLHLQDRMQRLAKLSPERRATFERITELREAIGPVDFDISQALREIREES